MDGLSWMDAAGSSCDHRRLHRELVPEKVKVERVNDSRQVSFHQESNFIHL